MRSRLRRTPATCPLGDPQLVVPEVAPLVEELAGQPGPHHAIDGGPRSGNHPLHGERWRSEEAAPARQDRFQGPDLQLGQRLADRRWGEAGCDGSSLAGGAVEAVIVALATVELGGAAEHPGDLLPGEPSTLYLHHGTCGRIPAMPAAPCEMS